MTSRILGEEKNNGIAVRGAGDLEMEAVPETQATRGLACTSGVWTSMRCR